MNPSKLIPYLLLVLISNVSFAQSQIIPEDLSQILGSWEGQITYLDYQTNKPFTMSANLEVKKGKNEFCVILNNLYPDEPKANNTEKIRATKNGKKLNKHEVSKRKILENGDLEIQTEHEGKDDNKKARIRYTYLINQNLFVIKKEVNFDPSSDWIKRSEFKYNRKSQSTP